MYPKNIGWLLKSEFSLSAYYFELTWDDLKDDKLMEELCKKGVSIKSWGVI